jgi:hypothetical protein
MSDKMIMVPDGMLRAARFPFIHEQKLEIILEAALKWLSQNPIKPTFEQLQQMEKSLGLSNSIATPDYCAEWQRRMFLAPEPEFPEIADVLKDFRVEGDAYYAIIEAYRRGQKAGAR